MTPTGNNDDAEIRAFLSEGLSVSRAAEVRAKQLAEKAQRATSVWTQLTDFYTKRWAAHLASLFIREAAYFHSLENSADERWPTLAGLKKDSLERTKAALRKFPADFEHACNEAKLKLDSTSRDPRYTIRNFIRIEVDEDSLQARVTPRDGERVDIPVDVPAIIEHLVAEDARLFQRDFDASRFLKSLLTAYQAALREDTRESEPRGSGDERIPLRRVTARMSKNLSRFRLDEFNVDLATAIRENHLTVDELQLQFFHTRYERQGLLLYGMEGSGYVGFISFRKA